MPGIIRRSKVARICIVIVLFALLFIAIIGIPNGSYITQAISGHFRIMNSRVPIEKMLKSYHLDIETQNKLRLVLNVRAYATKELGLPDNKSYTLFSEINGKYPGWNVYCAPRYSVEPKKWCFPIAGCVIYRGYFSKPEAVAFSAKMEDRGYDVFIGPFTAYSTLGWYDDPILSSHLFLDSIHLAGLIIHELAHQKVYAPGDSRFNEGFAVAVERAGVLHWLKSINRVDQVDQALRMWDEEDRRVKIILNARLLLNNIYLHESNSELLSQKKDSIFHALKTDLCNTNCENKNLPKTDCEEPELNNAYFAPIDAYYSLIPIFNKMLISCDNDFVQFFGKIEELKKLPFRERQQKLESFASII